MNAQVMGQALVRWYEANRRTLPWREDPTPYRVLVSEIMLQQTGVETVLGYFERFFVKFPGWPSLAFASDEALLKAWEGMGYYKRAFNLREAARIILRDFHGAVPDNPQTLLRLPGVGPYTANAVAAIAYNRSCLGLDGNTTRVLSRLFAFEKDTSRLNSRRGLTQLGMEMMPPKRACDYNQALMELGALVCRPKKALCSSCPISKGCKAFQINRVTAFPVKPERGRMVQKNRVLGLVLHKGRVLISKRPEDGLLGGLWELPEQELREGINSRSELVRFLWECFRVMGTIEGYLGDIRHTVSHLRIKAEVFLVNLNPTMTHPSPKRGILVSSEDLHLYPLTAISHKALHLLKNP